MLYSFHPVRRISSSAALQSSFDVRGYLRSVSVDQHRAGFISELDFWVYEPFLRHCLR